MTILYNFRTSIISILISSFCLSIFLNDPARSSNYMASNDRMINEQRIGKNLLEECSHGLIGGNTPVRG
jgi:hypothetical protein